MKLLPAPLVLLLVAVVHAIRVPVWHQAKYAVQRHERQLLKSSPPPKQLGVDIVLKTKSRPVFLIDERSHSLNKVTPSNSYSKPYVTYHDNNKSNKGRYNKQHYKAQSAHFRPAAATQQNNNGNNAKESKKSRAVDFTFRPNHVIPLKKEKYFDKPIVYETFKEQDALRTEYQEPIFKPESYASFRISDHEVPFEPISPSPYYYNGGRWSSPITSQTDRPYTFHTEEPVRNNNEQENNYRPEGYAVFETLHNDFIEERKKFANDLDDFPRNHKIPIPIKQEEHFNNRFTTIKPNNNRHEEPKSSANQEHEETQEDDSSSEESTEFIPVRLYSQVRETEDSKHLPSTLSVEPNLKEIVKNSKIHTVYTEEGYEDSAYDHGAHVKNAESEEAYDKFNKESDHPRPVKDIDSRENESDSDLAGSSYGVPVIVGAKNNKYAKTSEVKTASLKDMGNGNMELEIKSQVKMLDTPNNGKELHKYINIYPKNYALPLVNDTTDNNTTALPIFSSVNYTKTINFRDNSTDNATSINIVDDISKHLSRSKRDVNVKSLTEDLHNINESEFNLPKETPTTTTENIHKKYPYYNTTNKDVNVNSPLRYAEDLRHIPIKRQGRMSFYEQADLKKECSEVEDHVDPIPSRVKDKNEDIGEEPKDGENLKQDDKEPKLPRLGSLGDKIDCFKSKYFGDNPLDSPIFQEETVGQPKPIFREFDKANQDEKYQKIVDIETKTKQTRGQVSENLESATAASFSLLTTPDYGTGNKPKNIYDQIDLINAYAANVKAEDAPERGSLEDRIEKTIGKSNFRMPKVSDIIFDNQNATESQVNSTVVPAPTDDDYYDELDTYNATDTNSTSESLPESLPLVILRRRRKRPSHLRPIVLNKHDSAFNRKRFISKPNKYSLMSVSHFNQIFPTTTFSPKYNVISEVHYKNEIKPNEQLNVFADIINNIKNASMFDELKPEPTKVEPITVKLHTNIDKNTHRKIKLPTRKIKIRNPDVDQSLSESQNVGQNVKNNYFYNPVSPTVPANIQSFYPRKKSKIRKEHKSSEQLYEELMTALKNKDYSDQHQQIDSFFKVKPINFNDYTNRKRRRKPPVVSNFYPSNYPVLNEGEQQDEPQQSESEVQESLDLEPIPDHEIYKKKRPLTSYTTIDEKPINIYFVPGMRPPPSLEKPFLYSDYRLTYPINTIRRRMGYGNHRIRRSPAEYSDVKRTNLNRRPSTVESSEENSDEDDDEYVPHRPTRYHYDPETKRIVYDKSKEKGSSEEDEDEDSQEEEEAEEEVIVHKKKKITEETTTEPSKPNTIYHKDVLDMKNGPTLIDFVNLVKSNPKYVEIKDPEPTEKSVSNTTSVPDSTGRPPAAFLDILNKVHNNPDYKQIKDPEDDKNNKKAKTTTEATIEEETKEEETSAAEVEESKLPKRFQNAPGGQFGPGALQVFDISEYLPKIRTYNPKTSIDYSKYKTIARSTTMASTRHHMSSNYNDDDDDEEESKSDATVPSSTLKEEIRKGGSEALEVKATTTSEPLIIITPENSTPRLTTTTPKPKVIIRQRKRPTTTQRTTTTTERTKDEFTTQHDEVKYTRATHRPPSRVYPRRPSQKIRIRTRTTTEANLENEEETSTSNPRRVINRRDNANLKVLQEIPSNHKPVYTPISIETITEKGPISVRSLAGQFKFAMPRLVTDEKNNTNYKDPKPGEPEPRIIIEREESRKRFVLRRPRVQKLENVENKQKEIVKVEPKFVIVEEDENSDDKNLNEIPTSAKLIMENVQHSTTFKNEVEGTIDKNIDSELLDVIGVAVKRIISAEKEEADRAEKNIPPQIQSRSFDISGKKSEVIPSNREVVTKGYIQARNIDVDVFMTYDPTMKHGGNYKHIQDAGLSNIVSKYVAPTAYEIEDRPEIKRLSDIVPKPFAFYSDPKLPTTVNQLNIEEQVVEEITADGDEFNVNDYDYEDAVKIFFRSDRQLETTTKRIEVKGIIKDPSKRLYFYAPVD